MNTMSCSPDLVDSIKVSSGYPLMGMKLTLARQKQDSRSLWTDCLSRTRVTKKRRETTPGPASWQTSLRLTYDLSHKPDYMRKAV